MLLDALLSFAPGLRHCFLQKRVCERFFYFMVGLLCVRGRRTLSAALPPGVNHSSFYRLFSKDRWSLDLLFENILGRVLPYLGLNRFIAVALDDTMTKKTGRLRGLVRWLRDAVNSKHYKVTLVQGLRWVHLAVLGFIAVEGPLALSVGLGLAQPLRKPKKGSSPEAWKEFRQAAHSFSAPILGAQAVQRIREALDRAGCEDRPLLMVVDAGYMNRYFLGALPERTGVVGRVRKDTHLVHPAPEGSRRRLYGDRAPTPEQLRQDAEEPWLKTKCFFGKALREIRCKVLAPVRWPHVTHGQDLRLIVVAPTSYWLPGRNRKGYNQPAYLLTTDLTTQVEVLIQQYLQRWEIEVLHRDLKSELGCGQAQVSARTAVQRVTPSIAAFYALLRLAALQAFGAGRDPKIYGDYPAYRKEPSGPSRPSARDLLNRLREDVKIRCPGLISEMS